MSKKINKICEWATVVGNYRFAEELKAYARIVAKPNFKEILEHRKRERTRYTK